MNKEIFILNNSVNMFSKDHVNGLIVEINKLSVNKDMKKFLLVASLNLLSNTKTTSALEYQLIGFRNQGKVLPEKTKSKYVNTIVRELNEMSASDFTNTINNLINYLKMNKINIKVD